MAATVRDGAIHCDFTGTGKQVKGPFNVVKSGSQAAAYFAVRALTDPSIPTNAGCFRPVSCTCPRAPWSIREEPAPVGSRTATIKRITGCILGAFKDVMPEKVPADSAGELLILAFGGRKPDGSGNFVVGELIAGGSGGSIRVDGADVIETDATNCMNLPAEALEMEAPLRVTRMELRADSGGAGTRRGGLGIIKEFEVLEVETTLTHRGERHFCPAAGSHGGLAGAPAHSVIRHADGREDVVPSKQVTTLKPGDRLVVETAGGGGYGDSTRRSAAARAADVADGKVGA